MQVSKHHFSVFIIIAIIHAVNSAPLFSQTDNLISDVIVGFYTFEWGCQVVPDVYMNESVEDIQRVTIKFPDGKFFELYHAVDNIWKYVYEYQNEPPALGDYTTTAYTANATDTFIETRDNYIEALCEYVYPKNSETVSETDITFKWTHISDDEAHLDAYNISVFKYDESTGNHTTVWSDAVVADNSPYFNSVTNEFEVPYNFSGTANEPLMENTSYMYSITASFADYLHSSHGDVEFTISDVSSPPSEVYIINDVFLGIYTDESGVVVHTEAYMFEPLADITQVKIEYPDGKIFDLNYRSGNVWWCSYRYETEPPALGDYIITAYTPTESDEFVVTRNNYIEELSEYLYPQNKQTVEETDVVFKWEHISDDQAHLDAYNIEVLRYNPDNGEYTPVWGEAVPPDGSIYYDPLENVFNVPYNFSGNASEPLQPNTSYMYTVTASFAGQLFSSNGWPTFTITPNAGIEFEGVNVSFFTYPDNYTINFNAYVSDTKGFENIDQVTVKLPDNQEIQLFAVRDTETYREFYNNTQIRNGLPPFGKYAFYVKNKDGISSEQLIIRDKLIEATPQVVFPAEEQSIQTTTPTFQWQAIQDDNPELVRHYCFAVYRIHEGGSDFIWLFELPNAIESAYYHPEDNTFYVPFNINGGASQDLQFENQYQWIVSVQDNEGLCKSESSRINFFVTHPPIIKESSVTFNTYHSGCNVHYDVSVCNPAEIDKVNILFPDGKSFELEHGEQEYWGGMYQYQEQPPALGNYIIIASNKNGRTDQVVHLRNQYIENTPQILYPHNNTSISESVPLFCWTNITDDALQLINYDIQVDEFNSNTDQYETIWRYFFKHGISPYFDQTNNLYKMPFNADGSASQLIDLNKSYRWVINAEFEDGYFCQSIWSNFNTNVDPFIESSRMNVATYPNSYSLIYEIKIIDPQGFENIDHVCLKTPDNRIFELNHQNGICQGEINLGSESPPLDKYIINVCDKEGNQSEDFFDVTNVIDHTVSLFSPAQGQILNETVLVFNWFEVHDDKTTTKLFELTLNKLNENGSVKIWCFELDAKNSNFYNSDNDSYQVSFNMNGEALEEIQFNYSYQWQVKAICNDDNESHSNFYNFIVIMSIPDQIIALTQKIENLNLIKGIENSLLSQLESIDKSVSKGEYDTAVNKINAFINHVKAQKGKKINEMDADIIIQSAEKMIENIHLQLIAKNITEDQEADFKNIIPDQFSLSQNYPNPFNPETHFSIDLPEQSHVSIKIYDILGSEVTILSNQIMEAGYYKLMWNGKNDKGDSMPSGIYFYTFDTGHIHITKKMILQR